MSRIDLSQISDKQYAFLSASKKHVGFGGARGGGKSWSVRTKAKILAVSFPGIKILIVRRTFPELVNNHINQLQEELNGVARYNKTEKVFTFPNGSTIKFGYCNNDKDLLQYQGAEFDVVFLDEATQLQEMWIKKITACVRGVNDFPNDFGQDMGFRLPVFDIKVSAQKKNVYTKVSQNELALQFFQQGFFNPQMTDQALMCLEMMDFDGKDGIMQKVAQNGTMYQKLLQYMQLALHFAQTVDPMVADQISMDVIQTMGGAAPVGGGNAQMFQSDHIAGVGKKEPAHVANARSRSNEAAQPDGGKVTAREGKK